MIKVYMLCSVLHTPYTYTVKYTTMQSKALFRISDEYKPVERVERFVAEFLGTLMLVFLGCMGCVDGITNGALTHFQLAFSFGLAVMIPVQMVAHISGSHLNPIITIASLILGNISLVSAAMYFVAQILGSTAGYAILMGLTPRNYMKPKDAPAGVCSPHINTNITTLQGLGVEFMVSLVLVLVACAAWDIRNNDNTDSVPIKFGLTVSCLAMVSVDYTGCHMNPARSFGPAVLNGDWKDHWVYWLGPILGGVVGGTFYRVVFQPHPPMDLES